MPTPRRRLLLAVAVAAAATAGGLGLAHGATPSSWSETTSGPCTVRSHGGTVAGQVLAACRAAVPRVLAFRRTGWSGRVLVVVPRDAAELTRLAPEAGDMSGTAAVATADRVLVEPAEWRGLSAAGRGVVLAHEVTHLALRAVTTSRTPTWLVEGVAELVGLRGSGLPPKVAAEELATDVRRGVVPTALPRDAAFGGPARAQAYQQAWFAADLLARMYGDARLLALYAATGRGATVGHELTRLGTSLPAFTGAWRADVVRELT